MQKIFKTYFSYLPNQIYCIVFISLGIYNFLYNDPLHSPISVITPFVITPFFEWTAHKYFLHMKIKNKESIAYRYMQRSHYGHHEFPSAVPLVFAQFSLSMLLLSLAFLFCFILSKNFQASLLPFNISLGIYLAYEWIHLSHHTENYKPKTFFGKQMRKFHLWHHFKNENYWWGVTSPIADYILGTMKNPKDVSKSDSVKIISKAS